MGKSLKIGVIMPRSGPAGIWAPSCEASALLAAAEINAAGGVGGRPLELVMVDAGSTDRSAAHAAADAVSIDAVDAIVAMVTSSARGPVRQAIRPGIPFVYTPQFEGAEQHPDIITIGETAEELLHPGLHWLITEKRARRFFLIGNNYVWPQRSMLAARTLIKREGASVVGELELPFGHSDYDDVLARIRKARPDVVLSWLLGHEAIVFNRAYAEAGLAASTLRFSTAIDETILYGIGEDCTENLYVSSAYFSTLRSRNNNAFLEKYHAHFGTTPPPANAFGESLYEGIHCLTGLVEAAGSARSHDVVRKLGRSAQRRTARGFDGTAATGSRHPIHIAAVEGLEFRVLASH